MHAGSHLKGVERQLYELDHKINARGVHIDLSSAKLAHAVVRSELATANARLATVTGGAVETVGSHLALKKWLVAEGVETESTDAESIKLLLEGEHPPHVTEVLELRRDAGKTSVTKLPTLIAQTASDGRAHALFQFCGAGRTLRWAGRGAQPQNLQRPEFKQQEIEGVLRLLPRHDFAGLVDILYGPPITVLSSCLRALFTAAPGKMLTAADLANIEGRVAAWIAGERWKLDAFKAFDEKRGPDLYKVAYARTFGGLPGDVSDDGDDRQIGKIMELFLQFGGGFGAFATGADTYGFDILEDRQNPRPGRRSISAAIVPGAIKGWRAAHPVISAFWGELNTLAMTACRNPGATYTTGNGAISFVRRKMFLFMRLPNGHEIPYFKPEVKPGKYGDALFYWGTDSKTKQWRLLDTYGGKIFENAVQALARDIFGAGLLRVEAANMPIVMHIHDAGVTEHTPSQYLASDLAGVMCDVGPQFTGLPVSAKGYTSQRFQK